MNLDTNFYNDFPTDQFNNEPRYFCYDISRELIEKAQAEDKDNWYCHPNTVKSILLLLFCWNFAARVTKRLREEGIEALLKKHKNNLMKLQKFSIMMDGWEDKAVLIKSIFKDFKEDFGQTGASKALSLLNPKLFVMWDTEIRNSLRSRKTDPSIRINGIGNGEKPENYIIFLKGIKRIVETFKLDKIIDNPDEIAKLIDEYHYVKIVMSM